MFLNSTPLSEIQLATVKSAPVDKAAQNLATAHHEPGAADFMLKTDLLEIYATHREQSALTIPMYHNSHSFHQFKVLPQEMWNAGYLVLETPCVENPALFACHFMDQTLLGDQFLPASISPSLTAIFFHL